MKKFLSLAACLTVIASLAIGGTVAYLTDTDSDVNVMMLGNVQIEQHEYQRVGEDGSYETDTIDDQTSYVLEGFQQNKPLLPVIANPGTPGSGWDETIVRMTQVDSYGSMQVFATPNAQDKFVTVENTGRTDAYVRTIVAFEAGKTDGSLIGFSHRSTEEPDKDNTAPWIRKNVGIINIKGNNYNVYEFVYRGASDVNRHENGILPAGDTTYPSLCQVYLKSEATNEDIEAIDGNNNGTYDILVLSQAVQAQGFENAAAALTAGFGEVNAANVQSWFGDTSIPVVASTSDEVLAALKAGKSVVASNSEYNVFETETVDAKGATATLKGSNTQETYHGYLGFIGNEVTVSNLNVTGSGFVELGEYGNGGTKHVANNLVLKDMTSTLANGDKGFTVGVTFMSFAEESVLNDCVMTGAKALVDGAEPFDIGLGNNLKTIINGGEYGKIYCWSHSIGEIKGAEVDYIQAAPIKGSLTIGAGTHVGTINVAYGTSDKYATAANLAKIVIEEGATVDKIIYGDNTYTQTAWAAYVASLSE